MAFQGDLAIGSPSYRGARGGVRAPSRRTKRVMIATMEHASHLVCVLGESFIPSKCFT